jgi:hypothetical protein
MTNDNEKWSKLFVVGGSKPETFTLAFEGRKQLKGEVMQTIFFTEEQLRKALRKEGKIEGEMDAIIADARTRQR